MIRRSSVLLAAVALLVGACAQSQSAQTISLDDLRPPECVRFDLGQERADAAVVKAAAEAMGRGGYAALARHARALEQVVAHTPVPYDDYRSCKLSAALVTGLVTAAAQAKQSGTQRVEIQSEPSPYPMASFLAGAYATERGDFARAAALLEKGVTIAPTDLFIGTEYANALNRLRRYDEALTVLDRLLAEGGEMPPRQRALVQRGRGFAFIEMNRLDEAEAAYREALKHDPNHGLTLNQLAYIAQLRQGGARRRVESLTGEAARAVRPE